MLKPWTELTIPRDRPLYIRSKGSIAGSVLVVGVASTGVNFLTSPGKGGCIMRGVGYTDLLAQFEQFDGKPCGSDR